MGELARRSIYVHTVFVLVAGCANARMGIESSTNLKNAAPVTRLLIFENVQSSFLASDLYRGFADRMQLDLMSCGVMASIEPVHAPVSDISQFVAGPVERFHASSVMLIETDGGEVRRSTQDDYKLRFKFRLLDVASNKITWTAESKLFMNTSWASDDIENGGRFAAGIVTRLQDDGLLTGCSSPQ